MRDVEKRNRKKKEREREKRESERIITRRQGEIKR